MPEVQVIQIQRSHLASAMHAQRLKTAPEPPSTIMEGVVDVGNKRWRFAQGRLVAYFEYRLKPRGDQGPWRKFWTAPGY